MHLAISKKVSSECIAPTYIQNLVSLKSQGTYNLRSSGGILLASPTFRTKVTLGDRSFQVAAPKLWNALPRFVIFLTPIYFILRAILRLAFLSFLMVK